MADDDDYGHGGSMRMDEENNPQDLENLNYVEALEAAEVS